MDIGLGIHRISVSIYDKWIVTEYLDILRNEDLRTRFSVRVFEKSVIFTVMSTDYIWHILENDLEESKIRFEVV